MNSPYSNEVRELTIAPGCPWYEAQQTFGAPNVNWCEPTICSIINEPANTWSNIPLIIVGLLLVRIIKDHELRNFGWAVAFMGLMSFIYHATNNYFTQINDFMGMFTVMSFLITFNLRRLFPYTFKNFYALFWFFVFSNTFLFLIFDVLNIPPQLTMMINAIPIIVFDLCSGIKEQKLKHYGFFLITVLLMGIAQMSAIIDIKRIYCEPSNAFFHGHVIWHLLSAVAMLFMGLHIHRMKNPRIF